jgi:HK97 family phage portal protein
VSLWRHARAQPRQVREFQGITGAGGLSGLIPSRTGVGQHGAIDVTQDRALTHSGVWAACRIRADLMSTFPVDVLRDLDYGDGPIPTLQPKSPIMIDTGGVEWPFIDWMWASNFNLDLSGNALGIIRERSGFATKYYPQGLPAVIELQDSRDCTVIIKGGRKKYRIAGEEYEAWEIYHEKQYPLAGSPVGMSPLLYAARSIGEWLSLQQYGLDWFSGGGIPKGWMRNTAKRLNSTDRDLAKQWYQDTVRNGDLMVTGHDWEYSMIQAEQAGVEWLEGRRYGLVDVARFFGVPAEMLDAAVEGQAITYANITQRNLQFLIMNLGPAVQRREHALTRLLPTPRYAKLNTKSLLRLDPQTQQEIFRDQLETWQLTLSEVRELDNRPKLTPDQLAEMRDIYGRPAAAGQLPPAPPKPAAAPSSSTPDKAAATAERVRSILTRRRFALGPTLPPTSGEPATAGEREG